MFLLFQTQISVYESELFCSLQILPIWTSPEICRFVKSYTFYPQCYVVKQPVPQGEKCVQYDKGKSQESMDQVH